MRGVVTYQEAVEWARAQRSVDVDDRPHICLVTGVFDILTAGHVSLIHYAFSMGNVMVGLNTDSAVRVLKGMGRPINNENDRMAVMAALRDVTLVFPIDSTTVAGAITDIQAEWWMKGTDYSLATLNPLEKEAAENAGTFIVFAPHSGHSSSKVIQQAQSLKY